MKVLLKMSVKEQTKVSFLSFLKEKIPVVRGFGGCNSVDLFFNNDSLEMVIVEEWISIEDHKKYIQSIIQNGVMEQLVQFLSNEPSITYYNTLDI